MKLFLKVILSTYILINIAFAQENCNVAVDLIKGTYVGDCVDGKAHGKGKSTGQDEYEGQFKNGYPDGIGTYTSSEKSKYTGSFKKGLMDGQGELNYVSASGRDTTLKGFWKKNKYVGEYEKPFMVNDKTGKVSKVDVSITRKNTTGNINIMSRQLAGTFNSSPVLVSITDIVVISGQYVTKNSATLTNSTLMRVQQMIFPFRARLVYSNGEMVEITFYEQADYDVNISFI